MTEYRHSTLYDLLEVPHTASADELQAAYRFQSRVWHPDRFEDVETKKLVTARQAALNAAWERLKSPAMRAKYDRSLAPEPEELKVFALPEQNRPEVWKRMAAWMKDEDVGAGFNRKMAFTAGDLLERNRKPSEKQLPYMIEAWDLSIADGFDPEAGDDDE